MFDKALGIGPENMLVDLLHAFHLGILKNCMIDWVWELILSEAWAPRAGHTADDHLDISVSMLHADLVGFYSKFARDYPSLSLTRIQCLTAKMFGTANKRWLALKGDEGKMFFYFLMDAHDKAYHRVNRGDLWQAAARSLKRFMDILTEQPLVLSHAAYQERGSGCKEGARH